jgi:hypothetical protein
VLAIAVIALYRSLKGFGMEHSEVGHAPALHQPSVSQQLHVPPQLAFIVILQLPLKHSSLN